MNKDAYLLDGGFKWELSLWVGWGSKEPIAFDFYCLSIRFIEIGRRIQEFAQINPSIYENHWFEVGVCFDAYNSTFEGREIILPKWERYGLLYLEQRYPSKVENLWFGVVVST